MNYNSGSVPGAEKRQAVERQKLRDIHDADKSYHLLGAQKKIKTATINFGYANGYMRSASNRAITYINSIPAKVLGRISMDLVTIDVSNIPEQFLHLGYPVEILGENATYEKVSETLGTHELETLISIGLGTQKKYLS